MGTRIKVAVFLFAIVLMAATMMGCQGDSAEEKMNEALGANIKLNGTWKSQPVSYTHEEKEYNGQIELRFNDTQMQIFAPHGTSKIYRYTRSGVILSIVDYYISKDSQYEKQVYGLEFLSDCFSIDIGGIEFTTGLSNTKLTFQKTNEESLIKTSITDTLIIEDGCVTGITDYGKRQNAIEVPEGVTAIGVEAFKRSQIRSITLPYSLISIGEGAFEESNLGSIHIPANVAEIKTHAFEKCPIKSFSVSENNNTYVSIEGVLFSKEKSTLIKYPLSNMKDTYTIPNDVIEIGEYAFSDCFRLKNIEIPKCVTTIGRNAFSGCSFLTDIYIKQAESDTLFADANVPNGCTIHWNSRKPEVLAEAFLLIEEEKSIIVKYPSEGAYETQYRAIPMFEVEDDDLVTGEQLTWKTLSIDRSTGVGNIGFLRQGYWGFEVRTIDKNGKIIMEGSAGTHENGIYLQKDKENIVSIALSPTKGEEDQFLNTGKIKFGFETNYVSGNLNEQYVRIEVSKYASDGSIDTTAGSYNTMFPLKNGTETARSWGHGALECYDTSGEIWFEAPEGHPNRAYYGYSDGWTTVLPGQKDTGILTDQSIIGGFTTTVAKGRIRFYAETPDLRKEQETGFDSEGNLIKADVYKDGIIPGNYRVTVKVCMVDNTTSNYGKEIVIGGQSTIVKVVGGEITTVTGSILQEKYIQSGLSVAIPDDVSGILQSDDGTNPAKFIVQSDNLKSSPITFTFILDEETVNKYTLKYKWIVNGEQIAGQTGASFQYTPSRYGDAKITCIVMGQAGDTGNFGEVASDTVVVRVVQQTGPNI